MIQYIVSCACVLKFVTLRQEQPQNKKKNGTSQVLILCIAKLQQCPHEIK